MSRRTQGDHEQPILARDHRTWAGEHDSWDGSMISEALSLPLEQMVLADLRVHPAVPVPAQAGGPSLLNGLLILRSQGGPERNEPSRTFPPAFELQKQYSSAFACSPAAAAEVTIENPGDLPVSILRMLLDTNLRFDDSFQDIPIRGLDDDPFRPNGLFPTAPGRRSVGGSSSGLPGVFDLQLERDVSAHPHSPLPGGHPLVLLAGSDRRAQFEVAAGVWANLLVSDYRSNAAQDLHFSTRLVDLEPGGRIDPARIAALSSLLRGVGVAGTPDRRMVALVGGYATNDPRTGRGAMTEDGWLPPTLLSFNPGPSAPPRAVCYISSSGGGPVSAGDGAGDKHAIGTDADGVTHVSGHLDLLSPWHIPGLCDSPPRHIGRASPRQPPSGIWHEAFLAEDPELGHTAAGPDFSRIGHRGLNIWQFRLPLYVVDPPPKPEDDILLDPPLAEPEVDLGDPPGGSTVREIPLDGYLSSMTEVSKVASFVRFWNPVETTIQLFSPQSYSGVGPLDSETLEPDEALLSRLKKRAPNVALFCFGDDQQLEDGPLCEFDETPWAPGVSAGGICFAPADVTLDPRAPETCGREAEVVLYNSDAGLQTFLTFGQPRTSGDEGRGKVPGGMSVGWENSTLKAWALDSSTGARDLTVLELSRSGELSAPIMVGTIGVFLLEVTGAGGSTAASPGYGYLVDTTSAAQTIVLPEIGVDAAHGDVVVVKDRAGTAGSNAITVSRSGSDTIDEGGLTSDSLSSNYESRIYRAVSGGSGNYWIRIGA